MVTVNWKTLTFSKFHNYNIPSPLFQFPDFESKFELIEKIVRYSEFRSSVIQKYWLHRKQKEKFRDSKNCWNFRSFRILEVPEFRSYIVYLYQVFKIDNFRMLSFLCFNIWTWAPICIALIFYLSFLPKAILLTIYIQTHRKL
jgi:hypothetical protein